MLGARLRYAGLHPRALAAWAGTDRLSALPALLPALLERDLTPASTLLALFVAGREVPLDRLRLAVDLDALNRLDLIDIAGTSARARSAVLPIGQALLACDRLDTAPSPDLVCWPDDSSYHLALALPPGRKQRWLDLGSGSAFAPLMRPELTTEIAATDVNARAVELARHGAELSSVAHLTSYVSDLADEVPADWRGTCSIVSCNAPIPERDDDPYRPRWRSTDLGFIERLFAQAASCVAPNGIVVVHGAHDALAPVIADLPGERTVVVYTPPGARGFAVAWWVPGAEPRHVEAKRTLTEARPHLTHDDRIAALAGTLPAA
ncbi:MAG: methyltransferase small [Myxococcales bacterium]|nr:methyltransferase small [Myxococcales bacterium]